MKLPALIALATTLTARTAVFTFDFSGINTSIPDNNPSGISNSQVINDTGLIREIELTLNIDGGANGDLYVYLAHNDRIAILLNRSGRSDSLPDGYSDPGLHLTFSDTAEAGDVHTYRQSIFGNDETALGGPLTTSVAGPFQPDGRAVSPFSVTGASPRTAKLNVFDVQELSGTWTLFVADVASGDTANLISWSLQVTTVPEPISATITALALASFARYRRRFA